jgi:hypothetical protein
MLLKSIPECQLFQTEAARLRAIAELDRDVGDSTSFQRSMWVIGIGDTVPVNLSVCALPMLSPWRFGWAGSRAFLRGESRSKGRLHRFTAAEHRA